MTQEKRSLLRHASWGCLLLGVVLGCSIKQPAPIKQTFLLEASRRTPPHNPGGVGSLQVRPVQVAAPFAGRGFVYRRSDWNYEADFYHEFLVPPRSLMEEQVRRWFSASRLFVPVLEPSSKGDIAFSLETTVTAICGDARDPGHPKASLGLQFGLTDERVRPGALILQRAYRRDIPTQGRGPESLAAGWSQGLSEILAELEQDINGRVAERR